MHSFSTLTANMQSVIKPWLLNCNIYTLKCRNLKCAAWWNFAKFHTCVKTTQIQIENIIIPSKPILCLFPDMSFLKVTNTLTFYLQLALPIFNLYINGIIQQILPLSDFFCLLFLSDPVCLQESSMLLYMAIICSFSLVKLPQFIYPFCCSILELFPV